VRTYRPHITEVDRRFSEPEKDKPARGLLIEPGTWQVGPRAGQVEPQAGGRAPGTWHLAPGTWHLAGRAVLFGLVAGGLRCLKPLAACLKLLSRIIECFATRFPSGQALLCGAVLRLEKASLKLFRSRPI